MIQLSGGYGRILKWLRGMKLRQRVLLSYYLVVLLAVGTLSASVFHIVSSSLMDQNTFSLEQSFQQAGAYLAYRIRNIVSVSDTIMSNYTLNTILNRDIETYSRRQQFLDSTAIRQLIQSFQDGANIYRVHVYVDDRLSYADDGSSIHGLSKAQSAAWWEGLNVKRGQIAFVNDWYKTTTPSVNEPMLSMLRIMYRQSDYSKVAFVLQLDIPKATIVKTLQSAQLLRRQRHVPAGRLGQPRRRLRRGDADADRPDGRERHALLRRKQCGPADALERAAVRHDERARLRHGLEDDHVDPLRLVLRGHPADHAHDLLHRGHDDARGLLPLKAGGGHADQAHLPPVRPHAP